MRLATGVVVAATILGACTGEANSAPRASPDATAHGSTEVVPAANDPTDRFGTATIEPSVGAPGDTLTVTPADDGVRICSPGTVFDTPARGSAFLGRLTSFGSFTPYAPNSGATTTVPLCGYVPPPYSFVVPDILAGQYVLCLSDQREEEGCATFVVIPT